MAVGYNPRAVTDGLVLALDAGNPKNYNAGISTNWTDKVGGNNGTLVGGTYHNDGPFVGAGYVEFDGTGDYLSLASTTCYLGANDFTVEAWVYWAGNTALSSVPAIISKWSAPNGPFQFLVNASGFSFQYTKAAGGSLSAAGTTAPSANRWYHIAAVKYGSELKLYVDGVVEATTTGATAILNRNDNVQIGHRTWAGPPPVAWDGYISNLRLVSTALYTENFTPPTKSLTAITNTVLLTCQGNTIADASSSAHTITANGDISLTKEPFAGAGAVYFDGTGDYLSVADGTDFTLGTDNFTLECWVYLQSDSLQIFLGQNDGNLPTSSIDIRYSSGTITAYAFSGHSAFSRSGSAAQNSWHHIAWVRDGSAMRLFINGTQTTGTSNISTNSINDSSEQFGVGACNGSGGYKMTGYLSNVRLIKGTALYTSNFTPPSRTLEPIENTVLLTCQGQNIKDASSNAHAISVNGDAKATIVSSSFEFDGTDDYILLDNGLGIGTDDFAISVWVKFDSVSGVSGSANYRTVLSSYSGGLGYIFGLWISGNPVFEHYMDGTSYKGNTTIVAGTWYNMVSTRLSGDLYLYLNGSLDNTPVSASTKDMADTATPRIGWIPSASQNGRLDGTVSDLKIYKGKGLTASEVEQNYNALKGRYA